jgi:DNA polymerase (family 10)
MQNSDIARLLVEMADLLDLGGESPFKVRAYRQAAQAVEGLPRSAREMWDSGELKTVAGIGSRMHAHIGDILGRGDFPEHRDLAASTPAGLLQVMKIEGVGPKTAAAVWKSLGITDVDELEAACRSGRILDVPRMGAARVHALVQAIGRHRARRGRTPLNVALEQAEALLSELRRIPGVVMAEAAGSLRRRRETVGDVDLLVAATDADAVTRRVPRLSGVTSTAAEGPTKTSLRLSSGLQVDVRVVAPESFGAALHYFTGSKEHNIAVRTRAVRRGIKLNEYGVWDREEHRLGGEIEGDVFRAVGLPFIPPELREGVGEIEAAESGKLPHLIELADLRGDLHVHSNASSDGRSTLAELAAQARRLGRSYLAITDHSRSRPLGLDADKLMAHAEHVRTLGHQMGGPRLLAGIEVDILNDGGLDLPREVLAGLDWVVASIHSRLHDPPERITERLLAAIRSGVVDVIGHPTGRQIGGRDPYEFDFERVLAACRHEGVALEVNATPDRLDLNDRMCRQAAEHGVKLVISSDSHHESQLANLIYGVWIARRGWLTKADVLNTQDWPALRAWRRR